MLKRFRILAVVLLAALLAVVLAALGIYRASRCVPEFYRQALAADPQAQKNASDAMLRQTTALANAVKKPGQWEVEFTAEQINGWLAVDLPRNYPDLLPSSVSDPRVAIEPGEIWIGCQLRRGEATSVVSLSLDAYLAEPNVIALRIRKARLGVLPLPLETVLERVAEAASELDLELRWRQADGDPVAEITLPPARDKDDQLVRIDSLRLGEGKLHVSGVTERPGSN